MKRKIILSESKLRNYIKETIRQTILENFEMEDTPSEPVDDDKVLEYVCQCLRSPEIDKIADICKIFPRSGNISQFTLRQEAATGYGPDISEYYVYRDVHMSDFMEWVWEYIDGSTDDHYDDLTTEDVINIIQQYNIIEKTLDLFNDPDRGSWDTYDYEPY